MLQDKRIDWILLLATLPLVGAGLITLYPFAGDSGFFTRQLIWFILSIVLAFGVSRLDFRVFRKTHVILGLYLGF
jgi:cell division protein FtsW (lipid II flippase)